MDSIKSLIEDKKSAQSREGALCVSNYSLNVSVDSLNHKSRPFAMLLVSFGDQTEPCVSRARRV